MVSQYKATAPGGALQKIPDCYINVPNSTFGAEPTLIEFNILPEITDGKTVAYSNENIMGRASPMQTFSHSEPRTFNIIMHFVVSEQGDSQKHLTILREIQSLAYPRDAKQGVPYIPPSICQIKCGKILADDAICAILKSYSVKFPTDVAWDSETYMPVKFDIDTTWDVVYKSSALPGAERILGSGM